MSREAGRLAWGHIAGGTQGLLPLFRALLSTSCFQYLAVAKRCFLLGSRQKRQLQCGEISRQTRPLAPRGPEVRGAPGGTALHLMENMLMGLPGIASLFLGWDKLFGLWKRLFLHKTGFYHLIENIYPIEVSSTCLAGNKEVNILASFTDAKADILRK